MAISIDVANAFNSIPWKVIRKALRRHRVSSYLINIIGDYFRDRTLSYYDQDAVLQERRVDRGVPQGSVMGPMLWNLGYDEVLRTVLPPAATIIGYADDTILIIGASNWDETRALANLTVNCVLQAITRLGLRVAAHKSEAVYFYSRAQGDPPPTHIILAGTPINVGTNLKYLELRIDNQWTFTTHFEGLAPRMMAVANSLGRLLPNLGGPNTRVRKLYAGVVHSVVLYGAPVWTSEASRSRRIQTLLHRAQRRVAIRVIHAYRTVSHLAAITLAGYPPLYMIADMYADVYQRIRILRETGETVTDYMRILVKNQARQRLLARWTQYFANPNLPEGHVISAIRPNLQGWVDRGWGALTFRMTQVLTGHGCFGEYLCRIQKEITPHCHHCDHPRDTNVHTLGEYPTWNEERSALSEEVGHDLSIPGIVTAIIRREKAWQAFRTFCELVLSKKEEAERIRRGEQQPPASNRYEGVPECRRGTNIPHRGGRPRRAPLLAHLRAS